MAQVPAQPSDVRARALPEVPLKWTDFMWALERLRHRHYGKKMRERDWFRINPLDMVLLGSHTLISAESASRDQGTMVLVMECLGRKIRARPRYWQRLVAVLARTCCEGSTPALILQRCAVALVGVWRCLGDYPEFQAECYGWCITELKLTEKLQQLIVEKEKALGLSVRSEVQSILEEVLRLEAKSRQHLQELIAPQVLSGASSLGGETFEADESLLVTRNVLRPILCEVEASAPLSLAIQLHMMWSSSCSAEGGRLIQVDPQCLQQIVCALKERPHSFHASLCRLLSILQLVAERQGELATTSSPDPPDIEGGALPHLEEMAAGRFESRQESFDETKESGEEVSSSSGVGQRLEELLSAIFTALQKWRDMTASYPQPNLPDVSCKLLRLVEVIVATNPLPTSLPQATEFFQWPMSVLMAYSTEGYLSDSPHEFFIELLEFVSSLVEQGISPMKALQTNLPNLFGPVFGIRSHAVSCKLLEFGYLAACSQHQKSLLTEGLKFLMDVFHLFLPIDEVRARTKAQALHREAVVTSLSILNELLSTLPVNGESQRGSTMNLAQVVEGDREWEGAVSEGGIAEGEGLEGERDAGDEGGEEVKGGETKEAMQGERDGMDHVREHVEHEDGKLDETGDATESLSKSRMQSGETKTGDCDYQPVSDIERQLDKEARLQVLLRLFRLACAMIRNGDNISFLYASSLPKLFKSPSPEAEGEERSGERFNKSKLTKFFGEEPPPPSGVINWKVERKKLAISVLDLTILSVENEMATPFQLCGIVVPKLAANLDRMSFTDEEKLTLTLDMLKITQETLEAGHNIEELVSHGIDLLSSLLPDSASAEELRLCITQMAQHFVSSSQSSLLFLIKNACHFMTTNFIGEAEHVRKLFKTLVFRGKRDEIRGIFRVCKEQLKSDRYAPFRLALYSYATNTLSHRQLVALCNILITAMDVEKPQKSLREIRSNVEEEDTEATQQKLAREAAIMARLSSPCLAELQKALEGGNFKRDVWERVAVKFSQIALFRTLFHGEFTAFGDASAEELLDVFRSKFPPEVLRDEAAMHLLAQCATRIEHMQTPRYDSLRRVFTEVLRYFLTCTVEVQITSEHGLNDSTEERKKAVDAYVESMPRNAEDKKKLVECGYSSQLWLERLSLTVTTDGSHSLEENMRQTLLSCYREFSDILKQMAVTHVPVDGEMVKSSELFSDELSLTELKGRRAIAVRVIDEQLGRAKEGHFYERKLAMLSKEDEIEADFERQANAPVKPKTFTIALNTQFFDCARCCGPQIIGCYAPTGEHCERPLEIGLRCDSAVVSIYDESDVEIENVEVLFTEEGAYIFKAYSNGHPYDTSQVWVKYFTKLLDVASPLVPAIIVPKSFPNQRTWESLRRYVSTEMTGSMLTCRHDFSPEWRTYYDHRPERVRMGTDIILHPGFKVSVDTSRPVLMRQRSKLTKDLAGLIFEEVMHGMLEDDWLKQFRFLGKSISAFISELVAKGEVQENTLDNTFDYERWTKTLSKKQLPPIPDTLMSLMDSGDANTVAELPSKACLVQYLQEHMVQGVYSWCLNVDLRHICINSHKQYLELKWFLEKRIMLKGAGTGSGRFLLRLRELRQLLEECTFVVPIQQLPDAIQEEIIYWIFRNEDREWRYRGGRDGYETLQQFMSFLGCGPEEKLDHGAMEEGEKSGKREIPRVPQKMVYPGVAVFSLPHLLDENRADATTSFQVSCMIAYAVGEMAKPSTHDEDEEEGEERMREGRWHPKKWNCYEVVTAWVHPSYRGLNLAVKMYLDIAKEAPSKLVMCDMLEGSVARIIRSHWLLRQLERTRVIRMVLQQRQQSYTVITQAGDSEQFEQVVFSVWPIRLALGAHSTAKWLQQHPVTVTVATSTIIAAVVFLVIRR